MRVFERHWRPPLAGAAVVFRHRRRGVRPVRVALGVCGLLAATYGVYVLAAVLLFGVGVYAGPARMLRAMLSQMMVAECVVLMVSGAVLGACAAPSRESEEEIQAALMANVSPGGMCAGRLAAAMVTPALTLLLMCGLWLAAQANYGFQPADQGGSGAIVVAHLVLLCATAMAAAVGLLFALKRRPGREAWRGIAAGVLLTAVCLGGLFLAGSRLRGAENPVPFINGLLLINPVAAAEAALQRDMLRWGWVYDRVGAADYDFSYPSPWAACGVYIGMAAVALALSAVRLRRAYR